jgi:hypothetical protein
MMVETRRKKDMKRPGAGKALGTSQLSPNGGPLQQRRKLMLLRHLRSSAVTLTLSDGTRTAKCWRRLDRVPLAVISIGRVKIKKTMTGGIILEVLGDKESDKAPMLAARLTQPLDSASVKAATPTRTAERRMTEIDVSARRGF